jgi:acyl carrier protein
MPNKVADAEEIRTAVRDFVAKITEREPEEVADTADFRDDLEIDSLMAMEMMVAVNKMYQIEILDDEFRTIRHVADAVKVVQRHLAGGQ